MQTSPLTEHDQLELVELEEALWRTEMRFNPRFLQARLAPDFVEFGRSGQVYDRAQIMALPAQPLRVTLPLPHLQIRALDGHTAQLMYDSHVEDGDTVQYAHRSSIWSRQDGRWVLRFHQGTAFEPDPQASAEPA